jgi:hypothetical protein
MRTFGHSVFAAAGLLLAGCGREPITSYQIPKEDYSPQVAAAPSVRAAHPPMAQQAQSAAPHVHWDLPKGWVDNSAEQQRVGSFSIDGGDGKFAEVRIVPLRDIDGLELRTVSMWREELGLPAGTNDLKSVPVEVSGLTGRLYDLASEELRFQGKFKARTTAAVLPGDGTTWFIKLSGEESVVTQQQETFRTFLKSLNFHDESHQPIVGASSSASSPAAAAAEAVPAKWPAPATWQAQTPGQMVLAAYTAKTPSGASAEITVSSFPGDVGGMLANVNRWRGQVQLPPIAEADLAKEVKTIELSSGEKASAADMTGKNMRTGKAGRLYGLVVARGGQTWFYKMFGDTEAVAAEIANLATFAATAH